MHFENCFSSKTFYNNDVTLFMDPYSNITLINLTIFQMASYSTKKNIPG